MADLFLQGILRNVLLSSSSLSGPATPTIVMAIASGSVRTAFARASGASSQGANTCLSWRWRDKSSVRGTGLRMEFHNGYVNVAAHPQEVGSGNALPIRAAFLKNPQGVAGDQTAATLYPCTWQKASTCAADYIFKPNGSTPTAAEFTAAGGAVSADLKTLTLPSNWMACTDPSDMKVCQDGKTSEVWMGQCEIDMSAITSGAYTVGQIAGRTAMGDRRILNTQNKVFDKVWAEASTIAGAIFAPVNIWMDNDRGEKVVGVAGDSIFAGNQDSALGATSITGDDDGVVGMMGRALNSAAYSFCRTACEGDSGTLWYQDATNGGHSLRLKSLRYTSAVVTDMGHNNRGQPWSGAVGTGYLATMRSYWNLHRAATLGGAGRVIATELMPQAGTTSDGYATTANMTTVVGPGTPQYDSINPYMAAGVFDVPSGDPDAALPINQYTYQWATAQGLDVDAQRTKPPATGSAAPSSVYSDTTHPKGPLHTGIANLMIPVLPAKLGFSPKGNA